MRRLGVILIVCALFGGILPNDARAHNLRLFATAIGDSIEGTAYFTGGTRARGAQISAFGPGHEALGQTHSADDGSFRLKVYGPFEHLLVADTGDGHRAEFVIRASDVGGTPTSSASSAAGPTAAPMNADMVQSIDRALARHLAPLREQIDAYEDKIRLHDILGGIGYIVGLMGLAMWWTGRSRKDKP